MYETLSVGDNARYETVRDGLIPCKVLSINGPSGMASSQQLVTFQVTRTREGWKVGDTGECFAYHVVPLKCVRRTRWATYIRPFYVRGSDDV